MVAKLVVDHHVAYSNFCCVVFVDLNVSYYDPIYPQYIYIYCIYIIIYILVYVIHKMLGLDGLGCYAHLTLVVESSYRKDSQLMNPASRRPTASCVAPLGTSAAPPSSSSLQPEPGPKMPQARFFFRGNVFKKWRVENSWNTHARTKGKKTPPTVYFMLCLMDTWSNMINM